MNFTIKNLLVTLIAILAINVILRHYIIGNETLNVIIVKVILILISLFLIFKGDVSTKIKPKQSTIPYLVISASLVILSYGFINTVIDNSEILTKMGHTVFLISCLTTGIFEELFFRIYVFYYILKLFDEERKNKILLTLFFSSLIFGLAHITNFFNPNYVKISIINQVFFAFSLGVLFQSIYIRTKSIVFITTLHSLINYFGTYKIFLSNQVESTSDVSYSFNDFLSTFISILVITLVFIIPLSYLLLRKNIVNAGEELKF